jgi:cytoskeletal protein RodZ
MFSVGEILKKERERKGISLSQVEKGIRVRKKFLEAIEQNKWESFSSKVYISGIIKNYSDYLGLDSKRSLAFFRRDYERKEDVRFKRKISSKYLTPQTKKVAIGVIAVVFLIFSIYFGYQLKLYFSIPAVNIISPKINLFTTEDKIKITGQTEKDAAVTILGDRIFQNKDGIFEYDMPLKNGKNDLTVEVVGANGRKTVLQKSYYKKSP